MRLSTLTRSQRHILVATVSFLAVGLLSTTTSWAAGDPATTAVPRTSSGKPSEVITGLIASPLAEPHPVVGADGRRHLVYELQLINPTSAAVTVTRVETVDPATGRILATLDANAVAVLMFPFGTAPGPTLGPGRAGFILIRGRTPGIRHKAAFCTKQMSHGGQAAREVCGDIFRHCRVCALPRTGPPGISNRLPRQRLSPGADSLTRSFRRATMPVL